MKQEFKLLATIIRDNTPEDYDYDPEIGGRQAKRDDYNTVEVIPVSDPNASTMAQRVVQYQAVMQLAQTSPQLYDMPYLHRQMIENMGIKNAKKIIPDKDDLKPLDPVNENMNLMNGNPVKAFMHQDHMAHVAVHQALMQDPKIAAAIGQNPQAQAIVAALQAHIMEHTAFQYRREIEMQMGAALPLNSEQDKDGDEDDGDDSCLPPEIENQISQLMAAAAQKAVQKNQAEMQQQQAQQQMQDPIMQMQMQELQIKQQEVQIKAQQAQTEAQLKQAELQLKAKEFEFDQTIKSLELQIEAKKQNSADKLAGMKFGADVKNKQEEFHARGMQMGMDAQQKAQELKAKGMDIGIKAHQQKTQHKQHADTLKDQKDARQEGRVERAMQSRETKGTEQNKPKPKEK